VLLALERAAAMDSPVTVYTYYPTKGMERAERMGLIECFLKNEGGACAYRRTADGEKLFVAAERARKWWVK
jgi:hypothetical protein